MLSTGISIPERLDLEDAWSWEILVFVILVILCAKCPTRGFQNELGVEKRNLGDVILIRHHLFQGDLP